jgi:choline-sulfatase
VRRAIAHGAYAGALAGALAGIGDAAFTLGRAGGPAIYLLVAMGVCAAAGGLLGAFAWPVLARLAKGWRTLLAPDRSIATTVAAAVSAGSLLAGACWAVGSWAFSAGSPRGLWLVWIAAAAMWLSILLGRMVARSDRRRRWIALALVGLADAGALIAATRVAAETIDVRPAAIAALYFVALVGFALRVRPQRWPALTLLALALAGPPTLLRSPNLHLLAARHAPVTGLAVRAFAHLLDLDGDGWSILGEPADCAPFDGDVHPLGDEIPDNGRDDDCFDGDLPASAVAARREDPRPAIPEHPRPNILLVTIDTLRADRLGTYGYARATSPTLDALAKRGVVFERAYASSPVTDRSLPTMLGGLYPSMYSEALDFQNHEIAPRRVLLAERLRDAGYRTAMVSSTEIVERLRLNEGIDELDAAPVDTKKATRVTMRATAMLGRLLAAEGPWFLWVHYFDPHGPYEAPHRHRLWDDHGPSTEANRSDRYDGEVHYVDAEIGRLFQFLARRGAEEGTLVVVTADHGEEFFDHGGWYHAEELYDESVRVPWIVAGPGVVPGRVVPTVGLVDLMPTLLGLVDVPAPTGIEGRSQAAAVTGTGPAQAHPVVLEQWKHKTDRVQKLAVVDGTDKLILDLDHRLWERYDLQADPHEHDNRWGTDAERDEALRALLLAYWQQVRAARVLALPEGSF